MSDQKPLSEDPSAGLPPSAPSPPSTGGHWEKRGLNTMWIRDAGPADPNARPDSNMVTIGRFGIAPEDALMAGQAVRGVVGAISGAGEGAGAKAVAGLKNVASQAAPAIKYQATLSALRAVHVPDVLAVPAAIAVSGYKTGAKAVPSEPVTAGESVAAPAPAVAPTPATSAPLAPLTPKMLNEVTLAGRRLKTPLTAAEQVEGAKLMQSGQSAENAAEAMLARRTTPTVAPKIKLSGAEVQLAQKLIASGKTEAEALAAIQSARKLSGALPTDEQVRVAVKNRNATGRWE